MRQRFWIPVAALVAGAAALVLGGRYYYPEIPEDGEGSARMTVNQERHEATGFGLDSARVDSQITFRIPNGEADAVYAYLREKYVGKPSLLQKQFPALSIRGQDMSDWSKFTDSYYDTPTLDLFRNKNSARHRTRLNTTNPDDRKSGRELVQMKVTPPGQFTMRNELKYKCDAPKKIKDRDDLHPLIRLIERDQRADFKRVFVDAGLNPYQLMHVVTIEQMRRRGYIDLDGQNILSFSVDTGSGGIWWTTGEFASVDFGLVEVAYTEANDERRKQMWAIRDAVVADFVHRFPAAVQTTRSKYQIVLEQLMPALPLIPLMIRIGAVSKEQPH